MANPTQDRRRGTRSRFVGVKFTDDEYQRVDKFAASRDLKVAALVRASVLDVVDGTRVPKSIAAAVDMQPQIESSELRELRGAVNRVGGNVNQIARLCNTAGLGVIPESDDPASFTAMLAETLAVLREVQDALGGTVRPS